MQRSGAPVAERLALMESDADPTARDDLAVSYAQLLVSADRPAEALRVLSSRRFQPWEGGEGQVLAAWERVQLALAQLGSDDGSTAVAAILAAIDSPDSLGERRHPLENPAPLYLALGDAHVRTGEEDSATRAWQAAAAAVGDFTSMSPRSYSDNTYFSVLAARRLGDHGVADTLVAGLRDYVEELAATPARIDYFATSLPTLLLFHDDPQRGRDLEVDVLRAQLALLAGDVAAATDRLDAVLTADPSHALALDLRRDLAARSTR
jgi:hypothetical protein